MTTDVTFVATAQSFTAALLSRDAVALAAVVAHDVTWSVPGNGPISGIHRGVAALIDVATTIRRNDIAITIERIMTGRDGVTALLHEVGDAVGSGLDVRVALTMQIKDELVTSATSFISDVSAYDGYLA